MGDCEFCDFRFEISDGSVELFESGSGGIFRRELSKEFSLGFDPFGFALFSFLIFLPLLAALIVEVARSLDV